MINKLQRILVCILIITVIIPTISAKEKNTILKNPLIIKTDEGDSNNSTSLSLNFINVSGIGNLTTFGGSAEEGIFSKCYVMTIEFENNGHMEIRTFDPLNPLKNLKNILNKEPKVIDDIQEMLIIGFFGKISKNKENISINGVALAFFTI